MVVFLGLWIEKDAEKEEKQHLSIIARSIRLVRLKSELGWLLLMVGIAIEIADASWTAYDFWESKQITRANEVAIIKKTPGKMRVVTATAFVVFRIGKSSVRTDKYSTGNWTSTLRFSGTNGMPVLGMVSTELLYWASGRPDENLEIPLQFTWKQGVPFNDLSSPDESADILLEKLTRFSMRPGFLFNETPILGGNMTLVLNGSLSKTFKIPPQPFFIFRTNEITGQTVSHFEINGFSIQEQQSTHP